MVPAEIPYEESPIAGLCSGFRAFALPWPHLNIYNTLLPSFLLVEFTPDDRGWSFGEGRLATRPGGQGTKRFFVFF